MNQSEASVKRMASQVVLPEVFCGVVEHGLNQDVQLSMTSGSHKGPVHCDSEDALLMQFDGSKTVYLADPGYFKALGVKKGSYRRRAFHDVAVSDVDFWKPDETKHPGFAQVRWLRVEVQAGDMLYIPAYWFHVVQSEGARNLVVNHWFAQRPEDREMYDADDLDGDPNPADDECCEECWPCKIRTFCRHTLGANAKFPACKQTLEMEGVLTPGFKMDEAAGILPSSGAQQQQQHEKSGGGGEDGDDVIRAETDPDLALHTPVAPDWERGGGDFGTYEEDGDSDGEGDASDEMDDAELGEGGGDGDGDVDPEVMEEAAKKERDYDGSGNGDEVV